MFSRENLSVNLNQYFSPTENTTCRLCLEKYESIELKDIFNAFEAATIAEYVTNFANISIARDDSFSKVVCDYCLKQLKEMEDFKKSILNCNKRLKLFYALYNRFKDQPLTEDKAESSTSSLSAILRKKIAKKNEEIEVKVEKNDEDSDAKRNFGIEEVKVDILEHNLNTGPVKVESDLELSEERKTVVKAKRKRKKYKASTTTFACSKCDKVYQSKRSRDNHCKRHSEREYFECDRCEKKFLSKYVFLNHKKIHEGSNPFKCEECGKDFMSAYSLGNHRETHAEVPKYQCDLCGKRFKHPETFQYHHATHSRQITEVKCEICNRTLRSRHAYSLKSHMKTHLENRGKTCPKCGKTFKSCQGFNGHLKTHTDDLKFKCELCPKMFSYKKSLRAHMIYAHSTAKPFSCEICGKAFANKSYWYIHGKVHAKENPFTCKICEKQFGYPSHLKGHMRQLHGIIEDENLDLVVN